MPSTQYIAKTVLNARDAIASLVRWKITLLTATQMREPLSERATYSVQHPEECSVGQWLLSRHTLHLRTMPEYRAVIDLHTEFHREMQTIALLINTADYAAAACLLNAPTGFQQVCNTAAHAIMALDRIPVTALAP
jgi:1-deoxy-D-xylulose 5-phosphate reductoisomerase